MNFRYKPLPIEYVRKCIHARLGVSGWRREPSDLTMLGRVMSWLALVVTTTIIAFSQGQDKTRNLYSLVLTPGSWSYP